MLRSVELKDYMIHNPVKVTLDTSLFTAIHEIIVNKISGVCIVGNNDKLLGILSEMDCLSAILSATYNESSVGTVGEFMTSELDVAEASEDIVSVATEMLKKNQRRRPVVENGKLIGQITCRQLLRAVKEFAVPADPTEHRGSDNS